MRLVDADTLMTRRVESILASGLRAEVIPVKELLAAPTACCAECEHWWPMDADGTPDTTCCRNEVITGWMKDGCNPPADFGCSNFERRQP